MIIGGTARYGAYGGTALELASLPIMLVAALVLFDRTLSRTVRIAFYICAAILALPLLQLVPLPPGIWTALPGRQFVVSVYEAAGINAAWMPLSLSPPATLRGFLSLFPPLAVFLVTLSLTTEERRLATLVVIGFGIVSVALGLAQVAQGPGSPLRFYEVTNEMSAVGFFANRNHYAALLYCIMPFAAAWMIHIVRAGRREKLMGITLTVIVYGLLLLGLGIAASRAGILLAMLAILASLLLAWRARGEEREGLSTKVVFFAAILGFCAILQFGLAGLLGRMDRDPLDDGRAVFAEVTLKAAATVFPVGSGIGTFVSYYPMFETPAEIGTSYVNHAHNDWFELWLEGGVPAMILALAFLAWFAVATYRAWRRGDGGIDFLLTRAASISVLLLLIHSAVDYPLRTTALACLFAFACALVADLPTPRPARRRRRRQEETVAPAEYRSHGNRMRPAWPAGRTEPEFNRARSFAGSPARTSDD